MPKLNSSQLAEQIKRTQVPENTICLWYLGQEGFAVKGQGKTLYFDLYLSNLLNETVGNCPRNYEPPLLPCHIENADYIFISHDHGDHLDPATLEPLASSSPQAKFICPFPIADQLTNLRISGERIIRAKSLEEFDLEGIKVIPVACKHEDFLLDEQGNHAFLGYVIKINGITFYHAGDTIGFKELVNWLIPFQVDIACLPINGRDWLRTENNIIGNMGYREATDFSSLIGADLLVPMHYDLFSFNSENPSYFVDYLFHNYREQKFKMFVPGEMMMFFSER